MTPERSAQLVARWVRFYTRNLPAPTARRRIDEINADLHDHIAHERAHAASDRRIALSIVSRMVRGLAADAAWRGEHAKVRPSTRRSAMKKNAHRSTLGIVLATACILLLPLLAMLLTDEVAWGPVDFALAGALLIGTGLLIEAARKVGSTPYRVAVGIALAAALLLVWTSLALGVIGADGVPADLMYGGVLAVGILGALIARFRPEGMARALLATALAQALVAVVALIAGKHEAPITSVYELLGLNAIFVALFVASAGFFRHAASRRPPADAEPRTG